MLTRTDLWIGKHLFVPLIIRVCQAAGIGQFRFFTYASVVSVLLLLSRGNGLFLGWIGFTVVAIAASGHIAIRALDPDAEAQPTPFLRRLLLLTAPLGALAQASFFPIAMGAAFLAAEYALTIKTIPPRETERKRALATNPRRTR